MDGRSEVQCSFFVGTDPASVELCTPTEALYTISVSASFQGNVDLSVNNLPAGATATFAANPIMPGSSTTLTIGNTNALSSGDYAFTVIGSDGSDSNFADLSLTVSDAVPAAPSLAFPADGEMNVALMPTFTWGNISNTTFTIEVAADAGFTNLVFTANNITVIEFQAGIALAPMQGYFWRVKGTNICGEGAWSAAHSFSTAAITCFPSTSSDVPITISENGTPTVTSVIEMATTGVIDDVNVNNVEINHTWVSDIRIELTSPDGITIELMNNVGGGDCEENDIAVSFDDQSANPYTMLDGMCNTTPPALNGVFQPSMPLSAFAGEEAAGTWTLRVFDDANQDGGVLNNWELEICTIIPNDVSVTPDMDKFENCIGEDVSFALQLGAGFDGTNGVTLSANNLPTDATAIFNPNPAPPGTLVNVTLSGATSTGVFMIEIVADDGTDTGNTQIEWTVNGTPDAPTGISPAQTEPDVPVNPTISWSAVAGAAYELQIASDLNFTNVIINETSAINSLQVAGLEYCTTYFWQVVAITDCGVSDVAEVYSFTTEDDLSFGTSQTTFPICNFATVSVPISVGACFETGGVTLSAAGLPTGATATFSTNPVFSSGNVDVEIILNNVAPDDYTVTINGTDGTNNVSETLTLQVGGPAGQANLIDPPNAAVDISVDPMLVWGIVSDANNYTFELALDDDFTTIVLPSDPITGYGHHAHYP